jgi:AcrR family transcriptional regulator
MRGESTSPGTGGRAAPEPAGRATGLRRGLVEAEILDEAARLFAARGFAATSMQDIAAALGTSRPALYHYFAGKDEILARLVQGLAEGTRRAVEEASAVEGGAENKLDHLVRALITPIAAAPSRFRLILTSDLADQLDHDGQFAAMRHEVFHAVSSVIEEGCASGAFRRCDRNVAALAILGMINWVAWWYDPARGPEVDELSAVLSEMALAAVRAYTAERRAAGVSGVIASMRRDLDFLERAASGENGTTRTGSGE